MARIPDEYVSRKAEILAQFKLVLEKHLDDLMAGRIIKCLKLKISPIFSACIPFILVK